MNSRTNRQTGKWTKSGRGWIIERKNQTDNWLTDKRQRQTDRQMGRQTHRGSKAPIPRAAEVTRRLVVCSLLWSGLRCPSWDSWRPRPGWATCPQTLWGQSKVKQDILVSFFLTCRNEHKRQDLLVSLSYPAQAQMPMSQEMSAAAINSCYVCSQLYLYL